MNVTYLFVLWLVFCLGWLCGAFWATREQTVYRRDVRSIQKREALKRTTAGRSGRGPR